MTLQLPGTQSGRTGLDRVLAAPSRTILVSDFDGTLAPIVADPDQAHVHPDAVRVLGRLAGCLGGVAVVTGRPVADVLRLGGFEDGDRLRGLRILGQYGAERWDAGTGEVVAPSPHPGIERARRALPGLLAGLDLAAAHVEDKGLALAVHVRRLPDPDQALTSLRDPVAALAAEHELVVEPGKLVLELRAPGIDKRGAVHSLLEGGELDAVVYAGDDLGDLAGYDAVDDVRTGGGAGLLLCVRSDDRTALEQRADLVLDGPGDLLDWLDALADAVSHPEHVRPAGVDDATVEALGKLSEALEVVEDARGGLYHWHRMSGAADLAAGEAVDQLRAAGHAELADRLAAELIGRNVVEGRWTFQVVEEYDDGYYATFKRLEAEARDVLAGGRRHLFEAEMKQSRRTHGSRHHEAAPDDRR